MIVKLLRFFSTKDSSTSVWFIAEPEEAFEVCFTLEDEKRVVKVDGETRIAARIYPLRLNTNVAAPGDPETFHQRYLRRFGPDFHKGMVEICDVPNFTAILFHIGNDDDDTEGCVLPGEKASLNWVSSSTDAYRRMYAKMLPFLLSEDCWLHVIDMDG